MLANNRRNLAMVFVGFGMLTLGACASKDDVAKAQNTADEALRQAQQATQLAQAANQQAQQAQAASARTFQDNLKK